jgi:hypothetical protein
MALDKITSDSLATGAVNVSALPDGVVSAAKLHTTAISDKLGYTPVSPTDLSSGLALKANASALTNVENKSSATIRSEISSSNVTTALGFTPMNQAAPIFGYSTNAWQLLDTTQYGQYAITRKVKEFGTGTLDVCKFRINYGWGSYFFRMTTLEWGYLGGTMRQSSVNQIGTGTQVVSGSYSPWWFYNGSSNSQHTHTYYSPGQTGGGTDVGWYDVTARVVVPAYTSVQVVIEFGLLSETSSITTKAQIQLY